MGRGNGGVFKGATRGSAAWLIVTLRGQMGPHLLANTSTRQGGAAGNQAEEVRVVRTSARLWGERPEEETSGKVRQLHHAAVRLNGTGALGIAPPPPHRSHHFCVLLCNPPC